MGRFVVFTPQGSKSRMCRCRTAGVSCMQGRRSSTQSPLLTCSTILFSIMVNYHMVDRRSTIVNGHRLRHMQAYPWLAAAGVSVSGMMVSSQRTLLWPLLYYQDTSCSRRPVTGHSRSIDHVVA
ncbi:hypothetical protein BDA96_04G113800 [Sorghum bicolor]|uniref:Uncharacterized protein n=2 Tax=Sorghum bicolor TaxID=4558 RepID=A0A921UHR5_SORBI|nr:hypothetical protein BDA96_04G113800 [Sorghum bicolor]OQU84690.1 hypothetical protein SORBI_3004G105001 [Sorghum bicolor]